MVQVVKDIVTWLKQWFYTETEVDNLLSAKANKNLTNANVNVVTDSSGDITTEAKNNHNHGQITSAGKVGTVANKPLITTTNGEITTGNFGTGAYDFCKGNDSRLSNARTPTAHNQATSTITNSDALDNIKSGESSTLTLTDQQKINSAINDKIGVLSSIRAIEVVTSKPTPSEDTMGRLYITSENNKVNVYYTERTGTSPNYTYSWKKMDADILDELTISWNDIENKPAIIGSTIDLIDAGETNEGCIVFNTV